MEYRILSEEEATKQGEKIAKILMLRKDPDFKDRYKTTWGNKTAIGIYNVIVRMAEDIENGKELI